eukprot:scaffold34640_cov143-Amphora_coffeaeformis.AAC.7
MREFGLAFAKNIWGRKGGVRRHPVPKSCHPVPKSCHPVPKSCHPVPKSENAPTLRHGWENEAIERLVPARVVSAADVNNIRADNRADNRAVVPSFGLLVDSVSGNAQRVQVSGGGESSNNIGLTSKLKKRPVTHVKASVLTIGLFSIPLWRHSTRRYLSNGLAPAELCRLIDDL